MLAEERTGGVALGTEEDDVGHGGLRLRAGRQGPGSPDYAAGCCAAANRVPAKRGYPLQRGAGGGEARGKRCKRRSGRARGQLLPSNSSRPISMRRLSLVAAPMASTLASRRLRPVGGRKGVGWGKRGYVRGTL